MTVFTEGKLKGAYPHYYILLVTGRTGNSGEGQLRFSAL